MNDREYREKAQDVFNKSDFVFSSKTTFEKAFPNVEECTITVKESGHGAPSWNHGVSHYKNPGEYLNCSNPLCYNGGFNIGSTIREMVSKKETAKEDSAICQGYEGSPKGRRKYRKCVNFFKYTIAIKYRTDAPTNG